MNQDLLGYLPGGKILRKMKARLRRRSLRHEAVIDEAKILNGAVLARLNEALRSTNLSDFEFKVFSQWGEDGVIQHLVTEIDLTEKTFIEFGVEDFTESNCRFLMMKDNWRGLVIDGSTENIFRLKQAYYFWRHDLCAVAAFITRENINELLARSGFGEDVGILSVDIDGNDYHVLEAISYCRPRILILEYNAVFGAQRSITVPYDPSFQRTKAHHSNLYWGASLAALSGLAQHKGYCLVGTNSAGVNAFYVRSDLMTDRLRELTVAEAFRTSSFRESRDAEGNLTFLAAESRLKLIEGLPVLNVESREIEPL